MRIARSKWFLPSFSVALGLVFFAAQWIGGDLRSGLESLAVLAGFGALVLLGGRSETIRGLRGDGRDERFKQIDIHATALAGMAVITAIIRRIRRRGRSRTQRHALCLARGDWRRCLPGCGRRASFS